MGATIPEGRNDLMRSVKHRLHFPRSESKLREEFFKGRQCFVESDDGVEITV